MLILHDKQGIELMWMLIITDRRRPSLELEAYSSADIR